MGIETEEWEESNLTEAYIDAVRDDEPVNINQLDYISDKSPNPDHQVHKEEKAPQNASPAPDLG